MNDSKRWLPPAGVDDRCRPHPAVRRRRTLGIDLAAVEWPTVGLLAACWIGWCWAVFVLPLLGPPAAWMAAVLLGPILTFYQSLQHEVLHGHPTGRRIVDDALVFPSLVLVMPYQRYRSTHLAHHEDVNLTHPLADPESFYLLAADLRALPRWRRRMLEAANCLLGRMALGPAIYLSRFLLTEARLLYQDSPGIRRGWLLHLLGTLPVVWLLQLAPIGFLQYLLGAYLSLSLLMLRSFLEHRAEAQCRERSVIVEAHGLMSLLFLNNNLHAVHHALPQMPWYRLRAEYETHREAYLRSNGHYRYDDYAHVVRCWLLRPKEPLAWPLEESAAASVPRVEPGADLR